MDKKKEKGEEISSRKKGRRMDGKSKLREEVGRRKIRWTRRKEKRNIELGVNWETSYETDEEYEA